MIITEKEKVLLGIVHTCLWWGEGSDFEKKEVMFDEGWYEKVSLHL